MPITVGDRLPAGTLQKLGPAGGIDVDIQALVKGRSVILFGMPGAFTPMCDGYHLPDFVGRADELAEFGLSEVICMAVNDMFVMKAWERAHDAEGVVTMLADGNADFTRALDLVFDCRPYNMGIRCQRFAMILDDGVVRWMAIDPLGKCDKTTARSVLAYLRGDEPD